MTHAEKELERLKEAFVKCQECWSGHEAALAISTAEIFWPFVSYVLNHPEHSAEKTALINNFKHQLGMELMAHERFGVEE